MKTYLAELHVHTVLSPCSEIEMLPPLIVQEAVSRGIRMIGITDHNASANVEAVQQAAKDHDLIVLPGMEVQTLEEVHMLCLFDTLDQLQAWQEIVDSLLPPLENNPEFFGDQLVVDKNGDFIRRESRLLITSANLTLEDAVTRVQNLGGLAIPAHVDRKAFGLIANLGFVPPEAGFDGLEISRFLRYRQARRVFPQLEKYPLIQSGDVHLLDDFLGANLLEIETPTVAEIRLALQHQEGRDHTIIECSSALE